MHLGGTLHSRVIARLRSVSVNPRTCRSLPSGTQHAVPRPRAMNDREAKARAVKILAKSIYRDLEAQGFDEKQIVALATELISEVTNKISREHVKTHVA